MKLPGPDNGAGKGMRVIELLFILWLLFLLLMGCRLVERILSWL